MPRSIEERPHNELNNRSGGPSSRSKDSLPRSHRVFLGRRRIKRSAANNRRPLLVNVPVDDHTFTRRLETIRSAVRVDEAYSIRRVELAKPVTITAQTLSHHSDRGNGGRCVGELKI